MQQQLEQYQQKDQQGFETQQFRIHTIKLYQNQKEENNTISVPLPEAKKLIQIYRPKDYVPRIMVAKINEMYILPYSVQNSFNQDIDLVKKIQKHHEIKIKLSKIQKLNAKNQTLYDFIRQYELIPLYKKYKKNIQPNQLRFDYANKTQILKSPFDYNPKLYTEITTSLKYYQPQSQLQFDSNFESGNLHESFRSKKNPHQYYLILENDTNTYGYNEWFFFRARNLQCFEASFNIMNICKATSLHKIGMKIAIFSTKMFKKYKIGWFHGGQNINYYNNKLIKPTKANTNYYSLTFSYKFIEQNDQVYFALTIPYTYSKLINFLEQIKPIFKNNDLQFGVKTIGYSHSNNLIPAIIIKDKDYSNDQIKKKIILIIARQHPAETVGSFIAQGIIQFLSKKSEQIKFLIRNYNVVIIPMINPDGVILGHSRCNLSGKDLNRQWSEDLIKESTPETYYIKKFITSLQKKHKIEYFIDLHGHSKKMNYFIYGCKKQNKIETRIFSGILSRLDLIFDMMSCTYSLTPDKQRTIRAQLFNLGITNCLTIQTSYFGRQIKNQRMHFTIQELKNIGKNLIIALFISNTNESDSKRLYGFTRSEVYQQISKKIEFIESEQRKHKVEQSDSDPQGDSLPIKQQLKILNGTKILIKQQPFRKKLVKSSYTSNFYSQQKKVEQKKNGSSLTKEENHLIKNHKLLSVQSTFSCKKQKNIAKQYLTKSFENRKIYRNKRMNTLGHVSDFSQQNIIQQIQKLIQKQSSKILIYETNDEQLNEKQRQKEKINNKQKQRNEYRFKQKSKDLTNMGKNIFIVDNIIKGYDRFKNNSQMYKQQSIQTTQIHKKEKIDDNFKIQSRLIPKSDVKKGNSVFYYYPIL